MDIERCGAPIRYYRPGAQLVVEPCDRVPHDTGKHMTAAARARRKAIKERHEARHPERTKAREAASRRAKERRRYARDPEYRQRSLSRSSAWAATHPLEVMLYAVNGHAAAAQAALLAIDTDF